MQEDEIERVAQLQQPDGACIRVAVMRTHVLACRYIYIYIYICVCIRSRKRLLHVSARVAQLLLQQRRTASSYSRGAQQAHLQQRQQRRTAHGLCCKKATGEACSSYSRGAQQANLEQRQQRRTAHGLCCRQATAEARSSYSREAHSKQTHSRGCTLHASAAQQKLYASAA
jgi:hypothetical protein